MLPPFANEALTDFSQPAAQAAFEAALAQVHARLGRSYPLVIDGREIHGLPEFASSNPSQPAQAIGHFAQGGADHADQAVAAAARAFETWKRTPVSERASYLLRAAAEMRRRKHEFSAMMVLEVGKPWNEADADTAEAIDFLEYYARQALRITDSSAQLTHSPGEALGLYYIPLGVGAVIPPWNFPCAIPTGMLGSALVTGNTVVFKPAEQSPAIAWMAAELFWQQGLPPGVLNFLTGPGEVVGARMVEHPLTRFVSFTGSREVGIHIYETTARVQPGQRWLKRAILEMGGKDGILVDEPADADEAAAGIVTSAVGFQGQKCAAASRASLVDAIYDRVVSAVVERARSLRVGAPESSHSVQMGPVVDAEAMQRILRYIEIGRQDGVLLCGGHAIETPEGGYFIEPTVFGDIPPNSRLAQEEVFGPVLAVIRARDFEHGMEIANNTEYGLTGALYSARRDRLETARRDFHVGNLYLNRKCTGAMVGVNPFGGFDMSGTDSKAGGPDYLLLFTQAKSVTERL